MQLPSFKSAMEARGYLTELDDDQSTFAKKYWLETQIRAAKQGDRSIQEFYDVMVGFWDQLTKMEPLELSKLSIYKKYREEHRLVQFLIALRDEFDPLRKSILCRSFLPSVKEAVSELMTEETILIKSSNVSLKDKHVATVDVLQSQLSSSLSLNTKDNCRIGKDERGYCHETGHRKANDIVCDHVSGTFDPQPPGPMQQQSNKYSKPSSSRARSAVSSLPNTDETGLSGGLTSNMAKFAMAAYAVSQVSKALYNYFDDTEDTCSSMDLSTLKILTYNVWFREDLELHKRMKALGDLIQLHSPDVICFQEVTSNIYNIFKQSNWWKAYGCCSVSNEMAKTRPYFCMQLSKLPVKSFSCRPFRNSRMGRELCMAEIEVCRGKKLTVATSHLESPCPAPPTWDQMFSVERVAQAKEALNLLKNSPDVIFCGDMNWNEEWDGQFPLFYGWVDAWTELRPREIGWTYDTKSNPMLSGNRPLQKRLDRFMCKLQDFELSTIDMIGKEAIPGLSYCKEKRVRNKIQRLMLPVLPSDHYGLLLEVRHQ